MTIDAAIGEACAWLSDLPPLRIDRRQAAALIIGHRLASDTPLTKSERIKLVGLLFKEVLNPKPRKRGGDADLLMVRDIILSGLVHHIHEKFGFPLTRSPATRDSESACSIVARASELLRVGMSEDAIAKSFKRGDATIKKMQMAKPHSGAIGNE